MWAEHNPLKWVPHTNADHGRVDIGSSVERQGEGLVTDNARSGVDSPDNPTRQSTLDPVSVPLGAAARVSSVVSRAVASRAVNRVLSKDTQLCMSLAGRPGNHGTRFHNFLYDELGLDFVYKAFTTDDLPAAIAGIRALGIRGCSVSMPFKQDCIPLVDELDDSARAIDSVNTIVNDDGRLRAFNTDYLAVASLLRQHDVSSELPVAVLGSGGMAQAVTAALRDGGFADGVVVARNERTGRALAERYGFRWLHELGEHQPALVINATPVGMAGGQDADALPLPEGALESAAVVFDVVAEPDRTPLIRRADERGLHVITGAEVIALQAAEQFELYTGVRPSDEQVRRASDFARQ